MTVGRVRLAPNIPFQPMQKRKVLTQMEAVPEKRKKSHNSQVLITAQLIICLLIALAAFIIKTIGGDFYADTRQWYYGELNKSIIAKDIPDDYKLSEIFGTATDDEI